MMVQRLVAMVVVVLGLSASGGQAVAAASDEMMKELLRPAGWSAEWVGPGGSGLTEVVFEQRAEGVFARIRLISPFELTCEKPVTIDQRSVTFDGCRDPAVTLVYEPGDTTYPFRGRSPRGYEWRVKPK